MLDVPSHLTFRVHTGADQRVTLQFRRVFEQRSDPQRWQYDLPLDGRPAVIVARLRGLVTQILEDERTRLNAALSHLQSEADQPRREQT